MYVADPRSFGGRYIAADLFKETFAAYAESRESRNRYNAPVHNSAAVLSAEQFRRVLGQADDPACDTVVLLTGIPGAGKTSSVLAGGGLSPDTKAVFEGQRRARNEHPESAASARCRPTAGHHRSARDTGIRPAEHAQAVWGGRAGRQHQDHGRHPGRPGRGLACRPWALW